MREPAAVDVTVASRIIEMRRQKVLLDSDLAAIYGVETRTLNQAVQRNSERFPADFAFRLTRAEALALTSQTVISKSGRGGRRHSPWVFTEHGSIMAASILSSPRAVEMSVFVVRAFVRLRELARGHEELARQLATLERRVAGHDVELQRVLAALRQLLEPPSRPRRPIGFRG